MITTLRLLLLAKQHKNSVYLIRAKIHAPVCMYQDIDRAINALDYGMSARDTLESLIEFAIAIIKG